MIGYVTVGTNDLERAARFYDPIAAELGVGRMMDFDSFIAWGAMDGAPGIAATKPFDGNEASVGRVQGDSEANSILANPAPRPQNLLGPRGSPRARARGSRAASRARSPRTSSLHYQGRSRRAGGRAAGRTLVVLRDHKIRRGRPRS